MKKVLFLSNHFITLYKFRKELIQRLLTDGHQVYLSLPESKENEYFENLGCTIIVTNVDRRGVNPLKDIKLIFDYVKIFKTIKPDIIFSYTIKPNIYGSIVSNLLRKKQISNITGTGETFLVNNLKSKVAKILYRMSTKHSYKVFFQNSGDKNFFVEKKMVKKNFEVIPGSGVNLKDYHYKPMKFNDGITFLFIGRIMKIKGIDQYLEAAKIITAKNKNIKFRVLGFIEQEEYKIVLEEYHKNGIIEYLGFQNNIADWIENSHVVVLPSLGGEGVPNVLLEASAVGRVSIASNINGSNDVVNHEVTGYLYESENIDSLVYYMEKFIQLPDQLKEVMGKEARAMTETHFDRENIIKRYLEEL